MKLIFLVLSSIFIVTGIRALSDGEVARGLFALIVMPTAFLLTYHWGKSLFKPAE